MIYFLQDTDGGPVKVGHSHNVESRIAQHEDHYGRPMVLLGKMKGGRREEREILKRFAHLRLGQTEQLQPAPELMAFIGRPLLASANPEAVEVMPNRIGVVVVKGSEEWKDWIEAAAKHCRLNVSEFMDIATVELAKSRGFQKPPPSR